MSYTGQTDYAVPTAEYIREWLDDSGMSQAKFARKLGVSPKHVTMLLLGAPLTADMASRLEPVTGVPARIWLQYEALYRADVTRLGQVASLASERKFAESFPLALLRKKGLVTSTLRNPGEVMVQLFGLFQVGSAKALRNAISIPDVAFRQATAHPVSMPALATWLRLCEMEAEMERKKNHPPFDAQKLEAAIADIRAMIAARPSNSFGEDLVALLRSSGVLLIFVPEVVGARVYGATRWRGGVPVVALSGRGKSDGQFWFTLFHELGHVLLHRDSQVHVHVPSDVAADNRYEKEANLYAGDILIPVERSAELQKLRSKLDVRKFAASIGVSPGVVMGRLWHDELWAFSAGRDLCAKIEVVDD